MAYTENHMGNFEFLTINLNYGLNTLFEYINCIRNIAKV